MTVRDCQIDLRGLTFHYRDWGGRSKPLVLLHGLASQSHIFDLVAPRLAQSFRVVVLDQRGHGESSKPNTGYDFETIDDDLLAFLDVLKFKRAILAGHSWGGNVALQFAVRRPERVAALVLIDGGFLDIQANPQMTWDRTKEILAPPKLAGTPVEEFRARIKQYLGRHWTPEIGEIIIQNFEIRPNQTIRPHLSYANHMRILRAMWKQRPSKFYGQVQCPVLMLPARMPAMDKRAKVFLAAKRAEIARAAEQIPNSDTIWFNYTLHDIPLHRPRKLANVIMRFCQAHL
jgi:pimeloyl-ACP methyl ester carboxylesterase